MKNLTFDGNYSTNNLLNLLLRCQPQNWVEHNRCRWTPWSNFRQPFEAKCVSYEVITGMESHHQGGWWWNRVEDRKWRFRCCGVCHNIKPIDHKVNVMNFKNGLHNITTLTPDRRTPQPLCQLSPSGDETCSLTIPFRVVLACALSAFVSYHFFTPWFGEVSQ